MLDLAVYTAEPLPFRADPLRVAFRSVFQVVGAISVLVSTETARYGVTIRRVPLFASCWIR